MTGEGYLIKSSALTWLYVGNRIGLPTEISQMILHKLTILDDPPGWRAKVISKLYDVERKRGLLRPLVLFTLISATTWYQMNDIFKYSTSYIDMVIDMVITMFPFVVILVAILL